MGRRKKRISLGKDPQLTLSKQYRKAKLDPVESLKAAMIQANSRDIIPYTNSQNDSVFAQTSQFIDPEITLQIVKLYRAKIEERITNGWHYNRLSKELIHHPKDLTLRELSFVAVQLGLRLDTLIEKIQDGFVPENVENAKAAHYAEKMKKDAAEERISQLLDELKEKNQIIKELQNEREDRLHQMEIRGGRNAGEDSRNDRGKEINEEETNKKTDPEGITGKGIGRETLESGATGGNGEIREHGDSTSRDSRKVETPIRTSLSENEGVGTYKGPLA